MLERVYRLDFLLHGGIDVDPAHTGSRKKVSTSANEPPLCLLVLASGIRTQRARALHDGSEDECERAGARMYSSSISTHSVSAVATTVHKPQKPHAHGNHGQGSTLAKRARTTEGQGHG